MVSTTTWRPRSAARSPMAAAVVVLPTPPEPQQTMILVRRSSMQLVDVERHRAARADRLMRPPGSRSALGQPVERAQVDRRR